MSTAAPNRRRFFQFSLFAMLAVTSGIAIFLGYHINWIHERHRLLADQSHYYPDLNLPGARRKAPGLLAIFGEAGYPVLYVRDDGSLRKVRDVRRLFPEARINVSSADGQALEYLGRNARLKPHSPVSHREE